MGRLWIDEFFYSWSHATEWEDVPEPEKQRAIKLLKKEFGINHFISFSCLISYLKWRKELNE